MDSGRIQIPIGFYHIYESLGRLDDLFKVIPTMKEYLEKMEAEKLKKSKNTSPTAATTAEEETTTSKLADKHLKEMDVEMKKDKEKEKAGSPMQADTLVTQSGSDEVTHSTIFTTFCK